MFHLLSIAVNLIFAYLNFKGIEFSKVFQTITVGILLLASLFYVFAGISLGSVENTKPLFTSTTGLVLVMLMVPGFMSGFNVVAQAVEEANIKSKTIGKVVIATVWASTIFYIFVIIGASFSASYDVRDQSQLVVIESLISMFNGNELPKMFVAIAALIGMLTSWNAAYIGGSRVIYALGRAKYLPERFAKLNKKHQTPTLPIILLFTISSLGALLGTSQTIFTSIVNISGFMMALSWLLVVIAFKRIRKQYPDLHRPFQIKRPKLIGNLGLISVFGLLLLYTPLNPLGGLTKIETVILAAILIIIGLIYIFYVRKHPVSHGERMDLLLGNELSKHFHDKLNRNLDN